MLNFENASPEKQRTIINAGFLCFGQNGYQKTSVSDIAKASGISKASLFYYFGSKKDMYLFLCSVAKRMVNKKQYVGSSDYFECAEHLIDSFYEISEIYPNIFDFIIVQSERRDYLTASELSDIDLNELLFNFDDVFRNVDWQLFKEEIDREMIRDMVKWIIIGNISKLKDQLSHKELFDHIRHYLQILKSAMYREITQ